MGISQEIDDGFEDPQQTLRNDFKTVGDGSDHNMHTTHEFIEAQLGKTLNQKIFEIAELVGLTKNDRLITRFQKEIHAYINRKLDTTTPVPEGGVVMNVNFHGHKWSGKDVLSRQQYFSLTDKNKGKDRTDFLFLPNLKDGIVVKSKVLNSILEGHYGEWTPEHIDDFWESVAELHTLIDEILETDAMHQRKNTVSDDDDKAALALEKNQKCKELGIHNTDVFTYRSFQDCRSYGLSRQDPNYYMASVNALEKRKEYRKLTNFIANHLKNQKSLNQIKHKDLIISMGIGDVMRPEANSLEDLTQDDLLGFGGHKGLIQEMLGDEGVEKIKKAKNSEQALIILGRITLEKLGYENIDKYKKEHIIGALDKKEDVIELDGIEDLLDKTTHMEAQEIEAYITSMKLMTALLLDCENGNNTFQIRYYEYNAQENPNNINDSCALFIKDGRIVNFDGVNKQGLGNMYRDTLSQFLAGRRPPASEDPSRFEEFIAYSNDCMCQYDEDDIERIQNTARIFAKTVEVLREHQPGQPLNLSELREFIAEVGVEDTYFIESVDESAPIEHDESVPA